MLSRQMPGSKDGTRKAQQWLPSRMHFCSCCKSSRQQCMQAAHTEQGCLNTVSPRSASDRCGFLLLQSCQQTGGCISVSKLCSHVSAHAATYEAHLTCFLDARQASQRSIARWSALSVKSSSPALLDGLASPMPPIKLDFALEQVDQYQDAAATAKAGTSVTFAAGDKPADLFVLDQTGARLGLVPALLQQALLADTFTATVRSCRRQENKSTEITVRAVADGGQQPSSQLPGNLELNLHTAAQATAASSLTACLLRKAPFRLLGTMKIYQKCWKAPHNYHRAFSSC